MRYPYFWDYPPHRRRVLTVTACTCLAGVMLGGVSHMYRNPAPAPAKTTVLAERANQTGLVLGKDSSEDESTAPSSDGSPPPDPAPAGELSANGDTGSPPPPAPSVGATGALPTALEQPPAPSQALTSTQGAGAVEAPANSSARALPGLSGSPLGNLGAQRGEDAVGNGLGAPLSAPAAPKVRAKPSQKDEDDREHRPSRKDRDSQRGKDGQKDSDQGKPRDRQDGDDLDVDAVPEPSSSAASATAGQPVGPVPAAPPAGTALTPLSVPAQVPTQPSLAPAAPTSGSPVAALGAPQPASSMPAWSFGSWRDLLSTTEFSGSPISLGRNPLARIPLGGCPPIGCRPISCVVGCCVVVGVVVFVVARGSSVSRRGADADRSHLRCGEPSDDGFGFACAHRDSDQRQRHAVPVVRAGPLQALRGRLAISRRVGRWPGPALPDAAGGRGGGRLLRAAFWWLDVPRKQMIGGVAVGVGGATVFRRVTPRGTRLSPGWSLSGVRRG